MQTTARFHRKKLLFAVWATLIALDVAGLIWNGVRLGTNAIDFAKFSHVLMHFFISLGTISAVFLAEYVFRFRVSVPLAICCCIFAFCANTISNVFCMYDYFRRWDKILHSVSGILFAVIGLGLALLLVKNQPDGKRKVLTVILIAFLIVLAEGYLWEMFEFTVDTVDVNSNTQGWMDGLVQIGANGEYQIPDGMYLTSLRRGGAILDTMSDLILNFAGGLLFLIPCLVLFLKDTSRMQIFAFTTLPDSKKSKE